MKKLITNYIFNPGAAGSGTITLPDLQSIKPERLLLITNVSTGVMIYIFADPALGATVTGNIITLETDTSAMSSADSIQIFMDLPEYAVNESETESLNERYTIDTNLMQVLGSQPVVDQGNVKGAVKFQGNVISGRIGAAHETMGIDCKGFSTVAIQLSGVWAGTVSFEGSLDGGNFVAIMGTVMASVSVTSSTTANGIFRFNTAGLTRFRLRFATFTSGTVMAVMCASGEQHSPDFRRNSAFDIITWDNNLSTVFGGAALCRPGFTAVDPIVAPTVNPAQPASYAANQYANYPQIFSRLRVEAGGSERLPFAQEQKTNRMLVSFPELFSLLEQALIQLQILNQNFAIANNLNLPTGTTEIK